MPQRPLGVLITRPAHQAQGLIDAVEAAGFKSLACPTLVIEPLSDGEATDLTAINGGSCDIAIFLSVNAVRCANDLYALQRLLENTQHVLAIGPATAAALNALGIPVSPHTHEQFDSEHLLKNPVLQAINGKSVRIFRGKGGRQLISSVLHERGASMIEHSVYRRRAPTDTEFEHLQEYLENADVILSGSDEALDNLVTLASNSNRTRLLHTALIVNSDRGKQHAEMRGFCGQILVAQLAGDNGQLTALAHFARQRYWDNEE